MIDRLQRNARAMLRRRGPYEAFAVILTVALLAGGAWLAAVLVALLLVRLADRVGRGDA